MSKYWTISHAQQQAKAQSYHSASNHRVDGSAQFTSDEAVLERADGAPGVDKQMDEERLRMRTVAAVQALPDR